MPTLPKYPLAWMSITLPTTNALNALDSMTNHSAQQFVRLIVALMTLTTVKRMNNCWLKKLFCTSRVSFFLFTQLISFGSWSQKELRFHAVYTHSSLSTDKATASTLKNLSAGINVKISIDYYTHPLVDNLAPIAWGKQVPYYSTTMRKYRDAFFNNSFKKHANDFYFFITADTSKSFYIPNKNIFFLGGKSTIPLGESMFRVYAASRGVNDSLTLDSMVVALLQGDSLLNSDDLAYPFHDDVENLASSNGLVAYAFWEKNSDGTMHLSKDVLLPFKRNSGKVNLAVDNYWIRPFFTSSTRFIAPMHVALVLLAFFIMLVFRKKVNERLDSVVHFQKRWAFRFLRLVLWAAFAAIGYMVFWTTDSIYKSWFFGSTNYAPLGNVTLTNFIQHLNSSPSVVDQPANNLFWEVYIKERNHWSMRRMKKVVYFNVVIDSLGRKKSMRFSHDSHELRWKGFRGVAQTHLMVYTIRDEKGAYLETSVFNYSKVNISQKFKQPDVGKRILVFVNGYRPVSTSSSPDKALASITENGLEFSNSKNLCYTNDRFNYWRPWGGFDQKFIERIKPNEVYYADGHHSVATSNHGSILNFIQTASEYPKPCKGQHSCEFFKSSEGKHRTLSKLPFESNRKGFNVRRRNGKIAGKNLLQLLNEVPNHGKNDTLYFVAHSMGYAYALGMIDAIGKNAKFKAFYILAPENASEGKVNQNQWEEIYQYGCFAFGPLRQAACLQDGVAPQSGVKGLSSEFRLTFPSSYERKMGFNGSHFVGYYDWIFDIPKGQKGAVKSY